MKILRSTLIPVLCLLITSIGNAQGFEVLSANEKIQLTVDVAETIKWSVKHADQQIITPSEISIELENGEVIGQDPEVIFPKNQEVDEQIHPINYVKSTIPNRYNELTLEFDGNYGLTFRVYDNSVAYRFFTKREDDLTILNEEANFNFPEDYRALIPYMWDYREDKIFNSSFEALYDDHKISEFRTDSLAMLPLLVDVGNGKKAVLLEADLENYPGMYLNLNETNKGFKGEFPPYPLETERVARNIIPTERADYIAKTEGTRTFPWRVVVISEEDKDLMSVDIVQKLASPPRIQNTSWIKPGQVA